MKSVLVRLECITNMHVGNGDVNYNIIDNEVERDPVNNTPTINSSGVKGALRQYFANDNSLKDHVDKLFGNKSTDTSQGSLKIFSADLVAMPARASEGEKTYYMITSESALERYQYIRKEFLKDKSDDKKDENKDKDNIKREVEGIEIKNMIKLNGVAEPVAVLSDEDMKKISLPVMARNCLENGLSTNLWYEEVVPYKSVFAFTVLSDSDEDINKFKASVDGKVIQFGGEASIGYGFCKVSVEEAKNE